MNDPDTLRVMVEAVDAPKRVHINGIDDVHTNHERITEIVALLSDVRPPTCPSGAVVYQGCLDRLSDIAQEVKVMEQGD